MQLLQHFFQRELPVINDYLAKETAKLPTLVRPVAEHVLQAGGKRLRPLITILFSRCVPNRPPSQTQDIYPLACAMEFLHSATLLHDDILDGSDLRRGQKTAHLVFGKTETILAGDVLLALGNRLVAEYGDARLSWRVAEAIMRTASGEIQELEWIKHPTLSEEHYLEIITGKTAYLIQAACHCGALVSMGGPGVEQAALDFGINLGIAFQLTDDALDYAAQPEVAGKPVGNDLREGKLTLPLLLFLKTLSTAEQQDVLASMAVNGANCSHDIDGRQTVTHPGWHEEIIQRVRAAGCVERTRERAAGFIATAADALELLAESRERQALQEALRHTLLREK